MRSFIFLCFFLQSCSHVFYQPSKRLYFNPSQFKLSYKDVFFSSQDGTRIHAWFFPCPATKIKGTIVFFHGNAQNISTHFLNLAWIIKEGYNLMAVDYRGYGQSDGVPSQKGVHEDALAAFDQGHLLWEQNGKGLFIIYGQSLGGIISLRALADYDQSKVDLIIQDSTFSSYKGMGFNVLTRHWFLIPFSPLAYVLISNQYASYKMFKKITAPTLVVVGEKDEIVPAKFGKEIYKGVNSEHKWLWSLPTAHHIEIFHNSYEDYRHKFLALLDEIPRK